MPSDSVYDMAPHEAIETLEKSLTEAREMLLRQQGIIQQLSADPLVVGTVIDGREKPVVSVNGSLMQVERPVRLIERVKGISPGDSVLLNSDTQQIVELLVDCIPTGEIAIVQNIDNGQCIVEHHEGRLKVITGKVKVEVGDEVILDPTRTVIIATSQKEKNSYQYDGDSGTTWRDIGGLKKAKSAMIEAIELPFKHAKLYKYYQKKPVKGVELYGPPGCGKTMLAKAVVSGLKDIHGDKAQGGFFYVKGPEILSQFVGNAEAAVRNLFAQGRKYFRETGIPAVVAIDEAESILSKRGSGISSDMEKTIVPMFLAEMDGLDDSSVIVLLLTNREDRLDSAVVRPGRIDRRIKVDRPDQLSSVDIFDLYLKRIPPIKNVNSEHWPKECASRLFDDRYTLYQIRLANGEVLNFNLGHVCSGALIANIVDQATTHCLMNDIKAGRKVTGKGLRIEALNFAIDNAYAEARADKQEEALREFVIELEVNDITKFTQGTA